MMTKLDPQQSPPSPPEATELNGSVKSFSRFGRFGGVWQRLNLRYLGDRIIVGVFFAIVPTTISTYINRQSYYDDVVNAYLQDLRQYVVTDKIAIEKSKSDLKIDLSEGARELMHSKTTNSLIKLNENAAFLGLSNVPIVNKIAIFQDENVRRRAILFNVLRNSGLGFTSRMGEDPIDPSFLEGIEISDDSSDRFINLENTDLSLVHMNDSLLVKVNLNNSRFNAASLRNTYFNHSSLQGVNFYGADLTGAIFTATTLEQAKFNQAQLANANLAKAENITATDLVDQEAFLCNTTVPGGDIITTNCHRADLSGQDLSGINFSDISLKGANLTNANLTNAQGITLEKLEQQEVILCNTTLPDGAKISQNCRGADLTGQDLRNQDLTGVDMSNADLTDANLTGTQGVDPKRLAALNAFICRTQVENQEINLTCP